MTTVSLFEHDDRVDDECDRGAKIVGPYRYELWRTWDRVKPSVCWVMLNPSTADASIDDPTIRRCIGFAKRWGYGRIDVVNLFAYRATNPKELRSCDEPIGEGNDLAIWVNAYCAEIVVCAWGAHGSLFDRDKRVVEVLEKARPDGQIYCLGTTNSGAPKHPLYLADKTELRPFGGAP